ncbi:F-box domain-containing protein [Beauveria brongniartii RCEF 3172]|uniref:F-box domain-containing protein n=1 Tax=Beauveria brongniartii RCEF 3172 TaxID=1081107 RepID=A0A167K867_9HYPO|nr:F-box domain-containing protein [Beauveria brongniartii RCEF 3172]
MSPTPPWPTPPAGTRAPHRASVHSLPNELLACVLSQLDASSSIEKRFRDDASTLIDGYYAARGDRPSRQHPLKSLSLVSRRWRAAALPYLFRHVLWTFRRLEEPEAAAAAALGATQGFEVLAFLREHGLGPAVDSITLYVPCPEHLIDDPTELVGRFGLVPSATSAETTTTMQGVEGVEGGEGDAESVVSSETASLVLADANRHTTWSNTWFWDLLFSVVDPLRVSILAAPVVLATMLSRKVYTRCQPLMMTRYHLLSVSRADRSSLPMALQSEDDDDDDDDDGKGSAEPTATTTDPHIPMCANLPCELFARRRWTTLLANEGSSVSIYKTDAYGQTPPSPLLSLLASHDPATRRFLRCHLHRLAYVAIMPMATHFQAVLTALARLAPRRLAEIFVQIMPRGVDLDHLRYHLDPDDAGARFEGLEIQDLVMERDAVYSMLFTAIFVPGPRPEWEPLRVFETGDADDDTVAWAEAIETVRASTSYWHVAERGRFVRDLAREDARRRRETSSDAAMSSSSGAL